MHLSRPFGLSAAALALAALAVLLTSQFALADDEIVLLEEGGFGPANVVVSEGDSVTWNNDTEFACAVTFPGGTPVGSYAFPFSLRFDEAGTYDYQCAVVGAATFTGTVTVEEAEDEETPTATATATSTPGTETPTATNTPTNTPAATATYTNTPAATPTTAPATATPTTAAPTTAPSSPTVIPTPIPPATGTGGGTGGTSTTILLLATLALVGGGFATAAGARATSRS